ncbi:hypothetical protein EBU71_04185 [bacterium]|nr:hypothetical protein [Candidatus Elulimicrobium humile]
MAKNYFHLNIPGITSPLNEEGQIWFNKLGPCFITVPKEYYNPKLISWAESHGLMYWDAEVFSFPANYFMEIHVDATEFSNKCKLNWAYSDSEHYNVWYKPKSNWVPKATDGEQDDGKYDDYSYSFLPEEVTEVERCTVRTPTCIVSGQPHNVITTNSPRKAISVSLYPLGSNPPTLPKDWGISIETMRETLKNYVVEY